MKLFKIILLISIIFYTFSCSKKVSEEFGIDTVSPEIVATSPENNSSSISKFSKIEITFSESIDSSSVTLDKIKILPSIQYSFKVEGNKLIILPVGELSDGMKYWVTIYKGIKDKSGNILKKDYTFSFRTAGVGYAQCEVTFLVDNSTGKNYSYLYVAGSWDKFGDYDSEWNQGKRYMMYDDGLHNDGKASDGIWGYVLKLSADAYHTYTWVVDNDNDPNNGYLKKDDFVVVNSSPLNRKLYLYPPMQVTFNYYDKENKVTDSIYLRGDFNDWSMQDKMNGPIGENRLFTITKTLLEGTYNYKYYVDGDWEKVNKDNRSITVVYGETTSQNDYYAGGKPVVFNYYDIENKVTDYIYLKGDFNGWSDDNKMIGPIGENRRFYTTVDCVVGSTYSYKYYVDGDWNKVNSDNRSIKIESSTSNVNDYYNGPITVTFNYYDIEQKIDSSIHIRGDFNNWELDYAYELQCVNASSNKYSITLTINSGTYNYKYYVDGSWEEVNTANRTVTISATNSKIINDYYQQ